MANLQFFQRRVKAIRGLVDAFRSDRRGGVLIIFAAASMAIVLLIGGSIELHRRNLAVALMQKAADAAALAAKKSESEALLTMPLGPARALGEAAGASMFDATIKADGKVFGTSFPTATISWLTDGAVKISVKGRFVSMFDLLVPSSMADVQTSATVNYGVPVPTEVALVLDNTASMFSKDNRSKSRFTELRDASKLFTHQLFNAAEQVGQNDWLRISVVPWATTVNVLTETPRAADSSGNIAVASIPDYGSKRPVGSPILRPGRVNVNNADFAPVGWRGCIAGGNENPNPSTAGGMIWNALSIPNNPLDQTSVPQGKDESYQYRACTYKVVNYECPPDTSTSTSSSSSSSSTSSTSSTSTTTTTSTSGTQGFLNESLQSDVPIVPTSLFGDRFRDVSKPPVQKAATCQRWEEDVCEMKTATSISCNNLPAKTYNSCTQNISQGRRNVFMANPGTCVDPVNACIYANTETVKNVGPCVGDPNEWKWTGQWCPWVPATDWTKFDPVIGPNLNCPAPMLGLTGNRKQVLESLDRMTPVAGGTHADVGLRWGYRSLAPTGGWNQFFGLTKPPAAFGGKEQKIMILITDGENTQAIDYPGYWNCKGYENPGCSGTAPDKTELDRRMIAWCTEIKTVHKIDLFALAVNFTNPQAVALVEQCASQPKDGVPRFYRIDAAELKNILNVIAGQVIKLRITG